MLNWFKSKHRSILGVDISSSSVKILELSLSGNQYRVEAYGRADMPENAMEGNAIKDVAGVAKSIKKVIEAAQFSSKSAALSVPDSSTISKVIQVNEGLNEQEIEELVVSESDKYIPYPIDEVNIDFNVIGPSTKNLAMQDVLIVASRAENVNNRVEVINLAGLEAKIIDVESYAVERAAQMLAKELPAAGDKKNIAIIDIGAAYTHLFVLHGMKNIFSREEEFGAKQLIDAIVQKYGMERSVALQALAQQTLPDDYESEVLQNFKELILLQVKRALQFFFSTSNHTFVDHIVLAGGVAKLPGLAQLVQEHINIPANLANPFLHMDLAKKVDRELLHHDSPMLLVACGLALRRVE